MNLLPFFCGFAERLADLVCPPNCLICGAFPDWAKDGAAFEPHKVLLCSQCRKKVIANPDEQCPRCAGTLFYRGKRMEKCGNCSTQDYKFDRVIALGRYEPPLSDQILKMKKDRYAILSSHFAQLLFCEREMQLRTVNADYVIPVPMHIFRRVWRGVNSAEQIAHFLAKRLEIPCVTNLIRRSRWTKRQMRTYSREKRAENISGAFKLNEKRKDFLFRPVPSLSGKRILLVDDVLTTGSTCSEIAKVLRDGGAKSVTVAVLARTDYRLHGVPLPGEKS